MKRALGIHVFVSVALGVAAGTLIGLAISEGSAFFGIEATIVVVATILHLFDQSEE